MNVSESDIDNAFNPQLDIPDIDDDSPSVSEQITVIEKETPHINIGSDVCNEPITVTSPIININANDKKENSTEKKLENGNGREARRKSKEVIQSKFTPGTIECIQDLLCDSLFSGWIGERRWIDNLKGYRDIIEVDEWQDELVLKLKAIIKSIPGVKKGNKWINLTSPVGTNPCYSFYTLFEKVPIPGHYWFHLGSITSDPQFGLKFNLCIIRNVHTFDGESQTQREKRMKGEVSAEEWLHWLQTFNSEISFNLAMTSLMNVLTPSNINKGFRMIIILSITVIIGLSTFLQEFWVFLLRLIREVGIFIHYATPFMQSVVGFFEKIIGGFFILLSMIYKDYRQPRPPSGPPPIPRALSASVTNTECHQRQITYVPPEAWTYKKGQSSW